MNYLRRLRQFNFVCAFILFLASNASAGYNIKAEDVRVNTTGFDQNLNANDTTVQKALDKLDDLITGPEGSGGGDINSVGDAAAGAAFDGSSDGGTLLDFYNIGGIGRLIIGIMTGSRTWTLPDKTGTILTTGHTADNLPTGSTNRYFTDALARASLSETITGIDYSNTTGVFSATSGYVIPTTTEETNWNDHLSNTSNPHTVTAALLGLNSTDDLSEGATNKYANTTKEDYGQTAYGWGNHASAGYGTSNLTDADIDANTNVSYGVTAYNWGNHSEAGYVLNSSANQPYGFLGLDENGNALGIFIPRYETVATMNTTVLEEGEIATTSDTHEVRIGDGSTPGGNAIDYPYAVKTNQANTFGAYNQTFDTNTLFVDSANNRVGVGTITPDTNLHVKFDGSTDVRIQGFADYSSPGLGFYNAFGSQASPTEIEVSSLAGYIYGSGLVGAEYENFGQVCFYRSNYGNSTDGSVMVRTRDGAVDTTRVAATFAGGARPSLYIPGTIQSGSNGFDGNFTLYSEETSTDNLFSLLPPTAMSENVVWYGPTAQPTADSFVKINAVGNLSYDTAAYQAYNSTLHSIANLTLASGYLHYNGTAFVYDNPAGSGDMTKAVYDADEDGLVDALNATAVNDAETDPVWTAVAGDYYNKTEIVGLGYGTSNLTDADIDANTNVTYGVTAYGWGDWSGEGFLNQTEVEALDSLTNYYNTTAADAEFINATELDEVDNLDNYYNKTEAAAEFINAAELDAVDNLDNYQNSTEAGAAYQAIVTEGSLADSVIVSADIKDGEITAADTKITAGRSLSWSTDDIAADAELYTGMYNGGIYNVTTDDDAWVQIKPATAITISRVSCSCEAGNVTIQFDERAEATPNSAGTDIMNATLLCDTDTQATTTFDNAGIAADALINLDIDAVGGTPTKFRFHIDYTVDD